MKRLLIPLTAAMLLCGSASWADPGKGHGKGHWKDEYDDGPPGLRGDGPPGLAKKPYGMPPGQAKKMWRRGERIPRTYYSETRYIVVHPEEYRLRRPPPGYRWVLIEDDAYLVRRDNGLIAEAVANVLADLIR